MISRAEREAQVAELRRVGWDRFADTIEAQERAIDAFWAWYDGKPRKNDGGPVWPTLSETVKKMREELDG